MTALRVLNASGSLGSLQFNTGGELDGDEHLTFNGNTNVLTLQGTMYANAVGIGQAEDSSYEDGLFTDFVTTTPVGHAVDRFNEILKLLVPAPAPDLDDIDYNNTTVAKQQVVTANLSFGSSNNQTSQDPAYVSVGTTSGFPAVDVNGTYAPAANGNNLRAAVFNKSIDVTGDLNEDIPINQTNPSNRTNYVANSFGDANIGSLVLEVNGADLYTLSLTAEATGNGDPGSGTANHVNGNGSGFINVSATANGTFDNGTTFEQFKHRTGQWKVAAADQRNGWNYVRVKHVKGGLTVNTNYIEWVNDNNSDALATSNNALAFSGVGSTALSGVTYFTSGQGTYQVHVDNVYKYVYDSNQITFTTSNAGTANNVTFSIAAINKPAINTGGGDTHTKQIQISESGNITADYILGGSVTCGVNVTHPLKANLANQGTSTQAGILLYNLANNSTNTLETFRRENFRIIAGTYANQAAVINGANAWNSATKMTDDNASHADGLQFYNQRLYSPKNTLNNGDFRNSSDGGSLANGPGNNPNYSGTAGSKTFYRRFQNTTGQTKYDAVINIQGSGTIVNNAAALNGDKLKVYVKLPNNGSQETGFLDLATEFVLGSYANNDGAHTANGALTFDSSLDALNRIVLGTVGIANNDYIVLKIVADASWTGYISQIQVTFGAGTGAITATPNVSNINSTNTGASAKLSFGASKAIAGYTNVGTAAGFGAADINDTYQIATAGNNLRRGVFSKTTNIQGIINQNVGANTPDYVAAAFSDANQGELKLEVNGAVIRTQSLVGAFNAVGTGNPGSGSGESLNADGSGFYDLSVWKPSEFDNEVPYYPEIHRTAKFRVHADSQIEGWNYARVIHTVGGVDRTTNYVEWVNDSNSNQVAHNNTHTFNDFTDDTLNHLSGVKYFTQPKGVYAVTISNLYRNVYSSSNSAISFTNLANATGTRIQQSGAGLTGDKSTNAATDSLQTLSNVGGSETQSVSMQGTVQFSRAKSLPGTFTTAYNCSAAMTFRHPVKNNLTTPTLTKQNLLVYTVSNTSNANTNEHFTSENYRLQQDNFPVQTDITNGSHNWNSQTSIENGAGHDKGLLVYDGMLMSPLNGGISGNFRREDVNIHGPANNVDYSNLTNATREFYRSFLNNTTNDLPNLLITIYGDASIVGKTGPNAAALGANKNIFVELKIPGNNQTTGWLDLGKPAGAAGSIADGDGCLSGDFDGTVDGNGAANRATFVGKTVLGTESGAESFVIKVSAHKNWTGYLSRISVTWSQA